jgi:hypothetical protein
VWSGWVGIAQKTGFGLVSPLPGILPSLHLDTSITLPVGVEAYAAYALRAWLTGEESVSDWTRRFAKWSAICSFALGVAGQVAYHFLAQAGTARAPWPVTMIVSCLRVLVLGMGAALAHMLHADASDSGTTADMPVSETHPPIHEEPHPGPDPAIPADQFQLVPDHLPVPADQHSVEADQNEPAADGLTGGKLRIAEAQSMAARLTASGQRVSRRTLRAAGMRGSNADLGAMARLVGSVDPR